MNLIFKKGLKEHLTLLLSCFSGVFLFSWVTLSQASSLQSQGSDLPKKLSASDNPHKEQKLQKEPELSSKPKTLELIETSDFSLQPPEDWERTDESSRFGAELSLEPRALSTSRSIDLYREAYQVAPELQKDFTNLYAARLLPPNNLPAVLEPVIEEDLGTWKSTALRLYLSDQPRIQEHRFVFTHDGIYIFVLTTREKNADDDFLTQKQLARSLETKASASSQPLVYPKLGFSFESPKNSEGFDWIRKRQDKSIYLGAPIVKEAKPTLTGIRITSLEASFQGKRARQNFITTFEKTLVQSFGPESFIKHQAQENQWGKLSGYEIILEGKRKAGDKAIGWKNAQPEQTLKQWIVVLFGSKQSYILTLSAAPENFDLHRASFESLLQSFKTL